MEEQNLKLIEVLVWPATVLFFVFFLRNAIHGAITRLKGIEGPAGLKLFFEVRKVGERLQRLEEMTCDIYNLSGKNAEVRDEVFKYVANILNNKVSPQTAREMKIELNKYHMPRLGVSMIDLKDMLNKLGYYTPTESEHHGFNSEIGPEYIDAIYNYQKNKNMVDADGIIGPKTLDLLTTDIQSYHSESKANS